MVADINPHIVCIVETKLQSVELMVVASMLGINFSNFASLPAANTRGGILAAARPPLEISDVHLGCFSLTVAVRRSTSEEDDPAGAPWWLTVVYGPQEDADKVLFLEELSAIRDACDGAWALIGDFNLILDALFRRLSRELQSWAAVRIGNIHEQLLMAREIILKLDQASDRRALSVEETSLRRDLKLKCLGLSSLERTM